MVAVLIVLLYCMCCLCAGSLVMRVLWLRTWQSVPVRSMPFQATAFLLGQAILANVWLVLGLKSWLHPTLVLLVLLGCTVAGLPIARSSIATVPDKIREEIEWWSHRGIALRLVLAVSMVLLMLLGFGAFLKPPGGDAEAFYMAYPKMIAASERLIPMTANYWSFSQVGLIGEMHFAALMQLSGVQAAKLFVWPISLASAIMLMGVAAESGLGRIGQWFAVIILMTSTAFTTHITSGKVDLFAVALGISAFHWALKVSEDAWRRSALAITGLCTGFAVVSKLPYLIALVPSIFVLVMGRKYLAETHTRSRALFSLCGVGAQLALWTAIAVIPHIIKNGLFYGAPFAPLIGPPELTSLTEQAWSSAETTRWMVLTYPYALVFGGYPMQEGRLSFLLPFFLLLALRLPRAKLLLRHSSLTQLTVAAFLGTVLWVIVKPSVLAPRYIMATLLMFIPLAARGAEYAYEGESRWLGTAVLSFLIVAVAIPTFRAMEKWPLSLIRYVKGEFTRCELASKYCRPLTTLNGIAVPGARIYFAGYYSFWLRPDLLQCRQTVRDGEVLGSSETTKAKWANLFDRGFEYLVIDKLTHRTALVFFDKSQAPEWLVIENVWDDPLLLIYKIKSNDEDRRSKVVCRQISNPAWDIVELRGESAAPRIPEVRQTPPSFGGGNVG